MCAAGLLNPAFIVFTLRCVAPNSFQAFICPCHVSADSALIVIRPSMPIVFGSLPASRAYVAIFPMAVRHFSPGGN